MLTGLPHAEPPGNNLPHCQRGQLEDSRTSGSRLGISEALEAGRWPDEPTLSPEGGHRRKRRSFPTPSADLSRQGNQETVQHRRHTPGAFGGGVAPALNHPAQAGSRAGGSQEAPLARVVVPQTARSHLSSIAQTLVATIEETRPPWRTVCGDSPISLRDASERCDGRVDGIGLQGHIGDALGGVC